MFELVVGGVILGGVMSLLTGVRVLREYERAVVFRMGRARKDLLGPGLKLLLPFGIDRPRVIDVRTKAIQIAPQEIITRDNISISVDAVVYATIASPRHAVLEVEDSPGRKSQDLLDTMFDDGYGPARKSLRPNQGQRFPPRFRIQTRQRFVEEEDLGFHGQYPR